MAQPKTVMKQGGRRKTRTPSNDSAWYYYDFGTYKNDWMAKTKRNLSRVGRKKTK